MVGASFIHGSLRPLTAILYLAERKDGVHHGPYRIETYHARAPVIGYWLPERSNR